jgi:SMC interacting uncharacterized protein involved in chromosome segregation
LLKESNAELKKLARELDMFAIHKDDMRFEIYKNDYRHNAGQHKATAVGQ